MTKYDIMFESIQEKVNSGELTIEDAQVLNEIAFEKYGDDDTEYDTVTESLDITVIEEAADLVADGILSVQEACDCYEIMEKTGNNAVLRTAIKKNETEIKSSISSIKSLIKKKDYDKAESKIDDVISQLKSMRNSIDDIETDVQDDLISIGISMGAEVSVLVGTTMMDLITNIEDECKGEINEIDNKKEMKKAMTILGLGVGATSIRKLTDFVIKFNDGDTTNVYKAKAFKMIDNAINACNKLINKIKRKRKFDAFMSKNKKKLITAGAVAGVAAGAVGTAMIAKKINSNKSSKEQPTDKLYD